VRVVPVREPVRVLDAGEMAAAFSVGEDNSLWLAVNQVLRAHIQEATQAVSTPDLAEHPGTMTHTAGGLEWLSSFQADLADRWAEANGRFASEGERGRAVTPDKAGTVQKSGKVDSPKVEPSDEELLRE